MLVSKTKKCMFVGGPSGGDDDDSGFSQPKGKGKGKGGHGKPKGPKALIAGILEKEPKHAAFDMNCMPLSALQKKLNKWDKVCAG